MKEILESIIVSLVDNPSEVSIQEIEKERGKAFLESQFMEQ